MLQIAKELEKLPRINTLLVHNLQGNLKDLNTRNYDRLKQSIETEGFMVPLYIWFDPTDQNKAYTLDGHQRMRFFSREYPDGVELPYVAIYANDREHAKQRLMLIDSRYGQITKEGFDEFISDMLQPEQFIGDFTTFDEWLDADPDTQQAAGAVGTVPFSDFLDEESNYIVLHFRNTKDWELAKQIMADQLTTVASTRTTGEAWSSGLGRIIDGTQALEAFRTFDFDIVPDDPQD